MRSATLLLTASVFALCSCSGSSSTNNPSDGGLAGATSTGGTDGSSGGSASDGGASTGGKATGGGASTGGKANSGGAATGGNPSTGGTGTGGVPPCSDDGDCVDAVCDAESGKCVECTVENDVCKPGSYCNDMSHTCVSGCSDASDCVDDMAGHLACDVMNHQCAECAADNDCAPGKLCSGTVCVGGCNENHACAGSDACCNGGCVDLESNLDHCGQCDTKCTPGSNATTECLAQPAGCTDTCVMGFADCNGDPADGCEVDISQTGECVCTPGAVEDCYEGMPETTEQHAPCKGGQTTCDASGLAWGACQGQVLPVFDACSDLVDNDCDGTVDNTPDQDGDGWTICQNDCCDSVADCPAPKLRNPGAYDFVNGADDDCSGTADDAPTSCSSVGKYANVAALDDAQAADICQTTTANPAIAQKKWGLITASYLNADSSSPAAGVTANFIGKQAAVMTLFGNTVTPRFNGTMMGLSNGMMRDANDAGWVTPVTGTSFSGANPSFPFATVPGLLGAYVDEHSNSLQPGTCGNTTCPIGTQANDSIVLHLQMRVPTNANSFSFDFRFFSAEYQSFQCTQFNDHFLALLTSGAAGLPADHNIAASNGVPISVNSPFINNCGGNSKNCGTCDFGIASLAGTGFDAVQGGATSWLTTTAPVVPGETINLDLMIFDVGDWTYDSSVLVDKFRWSEATVAAPSTVLAQ